MSTDDDSARRDADPPFAPHPFDEDDASSTVAVDVPRDLWIAWMQAVARYAGAYTPDEALARTLRSRMDSWRQRDTRHGSLALHFLRAEAPRIEVVDDDRVRGTLTVDGTDERYITWLRARIELEGPDLVSPDFVHANDPLAWMAAERKRATLLLLVRVGPPRGDQPAAIELRWRNSQNNYARVGRLGRWGADAALQIAGEPARRRYWSTASAPEPPVAPEPPAVDRAEPPSDAGESSGPWVF
ncbi:MAG: hypothetical protein AAF772_06050 [Acidobacteriota bacterium]